MELNEALKELIDQQAEKKVAEVLIKTALEIDPTILQRLEETKVKNKRVHIGLKKSPAVDIPLHLSLAMQEYRKQHQLQQPEIAELIGQGITKFDISMFENGRKMGRDKVKAISAWLTERMGTPAQGELNLQ